jgi:SAM-dependent methyltransferase
VGDAGTVTGIDVDGALGRDALASLHARGHRNCSFVEGDIATAPRPAGPRFDIAYARLVLIHCDRPLAVLRRMWDWTAPGGAVVVQDYDLDAIAADPPHAVVDEFRRVCLAVFRRAGRPLTAGTMLRRQFAAAGLGLPDATTVDGLLQPMSEAGPMLESVYRSVLPVALEWGITSPSETDDWLADLAAAPAGLTVRLPLLVGAYRRKPTTHAKP